jgi:hypothetical protein
MASSSLARIAAAICLLLALAPFPGKASVPEPERARYEAAVSYCRGNAGQITVNEDKSIFCFDGLVMPASDVSMLQALGPNGLFVVRSKGGNARDALRMSELLEEKQVTVVLYDYCISACAHFFFVASGRTYVSKDTIVAWHHGWAGWPLCDGIAPRRSDNEKRLTRTFCSSVPEAHQQVARETRSLAAPFFKKRVINWEDYSLENPPQSAYMAKVLRYRFESAGTYPSVVWMWNPRYYKTTLKTEIMYDSYPESQDRVDELVLHHFGDGAQGLFGPRGGRVLHDP